MFFFSILRQYNFIYILIVITIITISLFFKHSRTIQWHIVKKQKANMCKKIATIIVGKKKKLIEEKKYLYIVRKLIFLF